MKSIAESLLSWFQECLTLVSDDLNPGAPPEAIAGLESLTGVALPGDFKHLYQLHDGQTGAGPGLFYGLEFLPISRIIGHWQIWQDAIDQDPSLPGSFPGTSTPPGAIQPALIDLGWIPFAHDFSGNHLGIDLHPGPSGHYGQVINYGPDEPDKYVLAQSLDGFLVWYYGQLQSGNYVFDGVRFDPKNPPVEHFFDALPEILAVGLDISQGG